MCYAGGAALVAGEPPALPPNTRVQVGSLAASAEAFPRSGCGYKPNVDELPASLRWVHALKLFTPKEFRRSDLISHPRFLGGH